MVLLDRQIKLLEYLKEKDTWIKGSELSKLIDVSDRTIRNDIIAIKTIYGEDIIKSSKSKGYKFNKEECNNESYLQYSGAIIKPVERGIYILKSLMLKEEDFYGLAEELFISECTLEADINKLRCILDEVSNGVINIVRECDTLKLVKYKKYKNNILYDVAKYDNYDLHLNDMQKYFMNINLDYLASFITEIINKNNYASRYLSITKLVIDIALMIESIYVNNISYGKERAKMADTHWDELDPLGCNKIALEIKECIESNFGITLYQDDVWLLSYILKMVSILENNEDEIKSKDIKEDEFYEFCKEILLMHNDKLGIDFNDDTDDIICDLILHIKVAMERMKLGIKLYNPLREKLKNEHTFLFTVALAISEDIKEKYGVEFDFNEVSYIVAYLATAVYRIRRKSDLESGLKVLLIVVEGKSNLKYIENEIKYLSIANKFDITGITNIQEIESIENINIDYDLVISTVNNFNDLNHRNNIVVQKSFTIIDKMNVKESIEKAVIERKKFIFSSLCREFLKPEIFVKDLKVKTKEEAIVELSSLLQKNKYIDDEYISGVIERERMMSTAIENGIALPHALKKYALKSGMAIGIIRTPISWGRHKVRVVGLFAYSPKDALALNIFLDGFIEAIQCESFCDKARKCSDFNEFLILLEKNI